jgi:hypothetical protein
MHTFSNGGRGQGPIERHLNIKSPHFVELNDGRRFYIDGFYLRQFNLPTKSADLMKFDWAPVITGAKMLSVVRYDQMLHELNDERALSRANNNKMQAERKAAREQAKLRATELPAPVVSSQDQNMVRLAENEYGIQRHEHERIADYVERCRSIVA